MYKLLITTTYRAVNSGAAVSTVVVELETPTEVRHAFGNLTTGGNHSSTVVKPINFNLDETINQLTD